MTGVCNPYAVRPVEGSRRVEPGSVIGSLCGGCVRFLEVKLPSRFPAVKHELRVRRGQSLRLKPGEHLGVCEASGLQGGS